MATTATKPRGPQAETTARNDARLELVNEIADELMAYGYYRCSREQLVERIYGTFELTDDELRARRAAKRMRNQAREALDAIAAADDAEAEPPIVRTGPGGDYRRDYTPSKGAAGFWISVGFILIAAGLALVAAYVAGGAG